MEDWGGKFVVLGSNSWMGEVPRRAGLRSEVTDHGSYGPSIPFWDPLDRLFLPTISTASKLLQGLAEFFLDVLGLLICFIFLVRQVRRFARPSVSL
jgi:hypothetical protein